MRYIVCMLFLALLVFDARLVLAQSQKVVVVPLMGDETLNGYEVVSGTSLSNSDNFKTALAQYPQGKVVIGGGGRVFGSVTGIAIVSSVPNGPEGAPNEWIVQATEAVANNLSWRVTAEAICIKLP